MNFFNLLRNVGLNPGPSEDSELWKMLEEYDTARMNGEDTSNLCTFQSVMLSDDVLNFFQHTHEPLISFLTERRHLEQLLRYISSSPENETTISQRCCKLLCHNFSCIREAVFSDSTEYLDTLFGFEDESNTESTVFTENLDTLHSSLLAQVTYKFMNSHNWYMVNYISSNEVLQEKPECLFLSDGLLQTLVDTNFCYNGSTLYQWMESVNFVDLLVDSFRGHRGSSVIASATDALITIIQNVSPLLQQFESKEVVEKLFQNAFHVENPEEDAARSGAVRVFKVLCERYCSHGDEIIPTVLSPVLDYLPEFNSILAPSEKDISFTNTSGNVSVFGMKRMYLVELYEVLLNIECESINRAIYNSEVFKLFMDAFFVYKWNNILQTSIMRMFYQLFALEQYDFCKKIFDQTNLIPRVSTLLMDDLRREKIGEPVSAYRGFFRSFLNTFLNLQVLPQFAEVFASHDEWQQLLKIVQPKEEDFDLGNSTDEEFAQGGANEMSFEIGTNHDDDDDEEMNGDNEGTELILEEITPGNSNLSEDNAGKENESSDNTEKEIESTEHDSSDNTEEEDESTRHTEDEMTDAPIIPLADSPQSMLETLV